MKVVLFVLTCALFATFSAGCLIEGAACASGVDCASGQRCLFPIGSCAAQGECKNIQSGPDCNSVEEFCGCDGQTVIGGCGFPSGFATGPTTGGAGTQCATTDAGAD